MKYSRHLLIGLLVLLLGGCGTTVHQSLKVQPVTKSKIGADRTVVILPFADYSYADNLETAYRRNLFVSENLVDKFTSYGFQLPVQEDVFLYLIDQNIINIVAYDRQQAKSLERELKNDWSDKMKGQLQRYITLSQNMGSNTSASGNTGTHGLTPQEVVKIGRHFSADYIVRGSIIQFKDRLDPSWEPWKKGIVPFVLGVENKVLFGQADSDEYNRLGSMVAGGATGALIGDGTSWPFAKNSDQTISGIAQNAGNTIFWAGVGAGLGDMAHHTGKIPQAVVQIRIWIQDAYTGNVVWTNRVDVKVSPESVFADYQYDALFEGATEKAIATLIDDFTQVVYREPVAAPTTVSPDTDKDGVPDVADHCPNTRLGTAVNALGCPAKETLVLEGVNFKTGSAMLTPESQRILDRTASALIHAPQVKVEVAGHTDSVGDAKRNLDLSNDRSLAVVQYLTSKGVAPTQLTSKGYGEEKPIASNATPEGRQNNRRTELHPMTR